MEHIRHRSCDGWQLQLDYRDQVLSLDIPEYAWGRRSLQGESQKEPLHPTLPPVKGFVPAAALLLKAKQFDDGLYAAVEMAAQQGAGRFPGKAEWLKTLTESLLAVASEDQDEALTTLFAACEIGGVPVALTVSARPLVQAKVDEFLGDEVQSKPLGFYTWSEDLVRVFRQDRLLQSKLRASKGMAAVVAVLAHLPLLRDTYAVYLRLIARLTNPLSHHDLRELLKQPERIHRPQRTWCVFPSSRSHETDLVLKLFGDRPIPEGFDLMHELIGRIRSGRISLEPSEHSGWYDYQTWSLEPLVVPERTPEATHLKCGSRYRDHLQELFKGAFALARETHVKQLEVVAAGCAAPRAAIWLRPELSVEPLATCYLRRAAVYRFVRSVLAETFGTEGLERTHRLRPDGPHPDSLLAELSGMESLFVGAYLTVCRELGLSPNPDSLAGGVEEEERIVAQFQRWGEHLASDPDVAQDARMMVPVFYDLQRRQTKVWAFLGWTSCPLDVSFVTPPRLVSCVWQAEPSPEPTGRLGVLRRKFGRGPAPATAPSSPEINYTSLRYELFTPVMAEVYVEKLLDRDEFRRHCDRYETREAILAHLR